MKYLQLLEKGPESVQIPVDVKQPLQDRMLQDERE